MLIAKAQAMLLMSVSDRLDHVPVQHLTPDGVEALRAIALADLIDLAEGAKNDSEEYLSLAPIKLPDEWFVFEWNPSDADFDEFKHLLS